MEQNKATLPKPGKGIKDDALDQSPGHPQQVSYDFRQLTDKYRGTAVDSLEAHQLRQKLALTYKEFFQTPQNTDEEASKISAILELASHDKQLCQMLEEVDEAELKEKQETTSI